MFCNSFIDVPGDTGIITFVFTFCNIDKTLHILVYPLRYAQSKLILKKFTLRSLALRDDEGCRGSESD